MSAVARLVDGAIADAERAAHDARLARLIDWPTITLATQQEQDAHARIRKSLRYLITRTGRCTGIYVTNIGAVARHAGLPVQQVAAHLHTGWLIILTHHVGDILESVTVEEDGE